MRFGEKIFSLLSLCVIEIYSSSHCMECQRVLRDLSTMGVEVRAASEKTAKERLALGRPTLWLLVGEKVVKTYFGWQRPLVERDLRQFCGQ